MRNYRNRRQIKTNGGKLAAYTLVLFEEMVKAIFNKAVRDGLIAYDPVQDLSREERFHAPDKHREYLTADELKRFLSVEPQTAMEQTVQMAFGFSCMTGLRLGDMQRLRWSDIKDVNGVQMVSVIQQDQTSRCRSAQCFGHFPVSTEAEEWRGRHHLPFGEEAG